MLSDIVFSGTNLRYGTYDDRPTVCNQGDIYVCIDEGNQKILVCYTRDVWENATPELTAPQILGLVSTTDFITITGSAGTGYTLGTWITSEQVFSGYDEVWGLVETITIDSMANLSTIDSFKVYIDLKQKVFTQFGYRIKVNDVVINSQTLISLESTYSTYSIDINHNLEVGDVVKLELVSHANASTGECYYKNFKIAIDTAISYPAPTLSTL